MCEKQNQAHRLPIVKPSQIWYPVSRKNPDMTNPFLCPNVQFKSLSLQLDIRQIYVTRELESSPSFLEVIQHNVSHREENRRSRSLLLGLSSSAILWHVIFHRISFFLRKLGKVLRFHFIIGTLF